MYNRLPAIDEDYQFPPEIRGAFAASIEFQNALINSLAGPGSPLPQLVYESLINSDSPVEALLASAIDENLPAVIESLAADPTSTLYSVIESKVLAGIAETAPGAVQDYSERTVDFTTTNTSVTSTAAGSIVGGLDLSVSGTGRAVELSFDCGSVFHSVADNFVGLYLITKVGSNPDSVTAFKRVAATSSPNGGVGRGMSASWHIPTVAGTNYIFKLGVFGQVAGTSKLQSELDSNYPITWIARNH